MQLEGGIGYWKPGFLDEECAKEKRKGEFLSGHEEVELSGRQGWVMSLEGFSSLPAASLCGPPAQVCWRQQHSPVENIGSSCLYQV